jgi:hypothetical protein
VLDISIREGRNRQVRRVLAKLGHKVRDLTRIKLGPLDLKGLAPGQFRALTPREVRDLHEWANRKPDKAAKADKPEKPAKPAGGKGKRKRAPDVARGRAALDELDEE